MGFIDQLLGCQLPSAHGYLGQQQASYQQQTMAQRFAAGLPPPYYSDAGRFGFLDTKEAEKKLKEEIESISGTSEYATRKLKKPKDEPIEYDEFEQLCNHKFHDLLTKFNQLKEEIE